MKNETLLKFSISQHNQTSSNFAARKNVYAPLLPMSYTVKREAGEIKSASKDRGFNQMHGDIVVRIQNFEAPWRSNFIFFNKGKSSVSSQMDVLGSDEIKEG